MLHSGNSNPVFPTLIEWIYKNAIEESSFSQFRQLWCQEMILNPEIANLVIQQNLNLHKNILENAQLTKLLLFDFLFAQLIVQNGKILGKPVLFALVVKCNEKQDFCEAIENLGAKVLILKCIALPPEVELIFYIKRNFQ